MKHIFTISPRFKEVFRSSNIYFLYHFFVVIMQDIRTLSKHPELLTLSGIP